MVIQLGRTASKPSQFLYFAGMKPQDPFDLIVVTYKAVFVTSKTGILGKTRSFPNPNRVTFKTVF